MHDVAEKKRIGAYYTPQRVARLLVDWTLRTEYDTLLEPSFGGCGFLDAGHQRLCELGCPDPLSHLFGYDIDDRAFDELGELFADHGDDPRLGEHFRQEDFLLTDPESASGLVTAVVGNPPYVSYHSMDERQRETARALIQEYEYDLDRKASLWAYFVLHALSFLETGGRIAWVLPGSFLQTEYAASVRAVISEQFERALALQLNERLFLSEGTEENSVILLAEGWSHEGGDNALEVDYVATLDELEERLSAWKNGEWQGNAYDSRVGFALMEEDTAAALSLIEDSLVVKPLGYFAKIKIGIVTGANRFFVINRERAKANDLEKDDLSYILSKFRLSSGLSLKEADFETAFEENERCLLADASVNGESGRRLTKYFETFNPEKRKANATFKKRSDWRKPDDPLKPDAFFPYMHQEGPRLILNAAGVNSTNTVHRVYLESSLLEDERPELQLKVIAISLLSSYSQLSAELEGRAYGSGVLKHEPSEARKIKLIVPHWDAGEEVEAAFDRVDNLLRQDKTEAAEDAANAFVLRDLSPSDTRSVLACLKAALHRARDRRSVKRNGY